MKYTQWRTWQALWPHIAGSSSTAVSAWPNPPSVHEMASERVSVKPTTHGERFELHGWIQNQCCEPSSVPVSHHKRTCSVVDKGIFQFMLKKNRNMPTRNSHNWPFWLELDISSLNITWEGFISTGENTKPGSPVWLLTQCPALPFHPVDCVDFFFGTTLLAPPLC